jgi:hypothetical protein
LTHYTSSQTTPGGVATDVGFLMKGGRDFGIDWSEEASTSLLKILREKLRRKSSADGDAVVKALNEEIFGALGDPSTRKATSALQGVVQSKND